VGPFGLGRGSLRSSGGNRTASALLAALFQAKMAAMMGTVKRRLTTVLCADVEGYTRLMEADETGALAALRRCREAMATLAARHDGRIVNTWGDAIIAEFTSVVEAVQCAVDIQEELSEESDRAGPARGMRFRIGINLGDVMVEGTDIYGEGVNIAARLQELAEPGGILISGPVYDQVHNKLSIGFDCIGHQQVKNVTHPVMSYRVTVGRGTSSRPRERAEPGRGHSLSRERPRRALVGRAWDWYAGLPRLAATLLAISGFLILINVFTGLHRLWFHWPVTALLLIALLSTVLRRR
jgi:adenylate cyclase